MSSGRNSLHAHTDYAYMYHVICNYSYNHSYYSVFFQQYILLAHTMYFGVEYAVHLCI